MARPSNSLISGNLLPRFLYPQILPHISFFPIHSLHQASPSTDPTCPAPSVWSHLRHLTYLPHLTYVVPPQPHVLFSTPGDSTCSPGYLHQCLSAFIPLPYLTPTTNPYPLLSLILPLASSTPLPSPLYTSSPPSVSIQRNGFGPKHYLSIPTILLPDTLNSSSPLVFDHQT